MGGAAASPEAKRPKVADSDADAELAARLAREEDGEGAPTVEVEFERFNEEDVLITDEKVREINTFCEQTGDQYVDPQFPPSWKSIYINEQDAQTWDCMSCRNRTPLPPVPPLPSSEEEAIAREAEFDKLVCSRCGGKAPFVVKARYFNRPTQWLRPGPVRCEQSMAAAPYEYPNVRDSAALQSLVEIMSTLYLRCTTTRKTLGQQWVVFRDEPRAEDVKQGALGNCWFAGALSVVASKPDLVRSLFITQEYNKHGAYQLQLFHAGEWRGILIDDLFPTSVISQGRIEGQTVYYSRGGELSYLKCGRHQLWVPLVEKAAAKLHGSYGHLSSGTFGEALALFTGFPTERLMMYMPKEAKMRRAQERDARVARRTEMLLRGEEPPPEDEEDLLLDDAYADDLLWTKLLSFRDAGYLMGMGCTEAGCEKTKEQILEVGLQAPHAYGILDVREITDAEGKLHRLVQIRNPWGEEAPRTWKGDWGKDSSKWTFDLKLKLGVVNRSNVNMYDQMSIFWMSFEDVKSYFAVIDVCRVHDGWEEYRERGWLPSGVGPGEAFDLTVCERTQVDIALWQEKHITRESALGASTNVDVGLAVLRRRGTNEDGSHEFECVEYIKRSMDDCVSQEMILEGGYVYHLVPMCFNQMQAFAPRRVTMVVHSSNPVTLQKMGSSWETLSRAACAAAALKGKSIGAAVGGVRNTFLREDRAGYIFVAENGSDAPLGLQVDASDSIGMVSSREGGSCGCIDLVPARSRKVVIALAHKQGAQRTAVSFAFDALPAEAAAWAVGAEGLHAAIPLTPLALQQGPVAPDEAVLQTSPPPRLRKPLAARGGQPTPTAKAGAPRSLEEMQAEREAEETLAEALRLSLQDAGGGAAADGSGSPMAVEDDDDDELARAIRMSMQPSSESTPAPAAPSAPTPAAAPAPAVASAPDKEAVKELFERYKAQGMDANAAAAQAMKDAAAGGAAQPAAAPPPQGQVDMKQLVKDLFEQYRREGMSPNEAAIRSMNEAKARQASAGKGP